MKERTIWVLSTLFALILILVIIWFLPKAQPLVLGDEICDLQDNNQNGIVDEGFRITCTTDANCGPSGNFGAAYCRGGNLWQASLKQSCINHKGTCLSECVAEQSEVQVRECPNSCYNGQCR